MNSVPMPIESSPRGLPRPARSRRWRPSPVWLVPLLALLAAAWLAARAIWRRGPVVTITFATAEGLEPRRTTIKYKAVDIGLVTSIELLDDRSGVKVTAELSPRAAPLLVDDARFWVVRPRVTAAGVSGIGTLLTGAHIGFDAGASARQRQDFVGLEAPPSTISGRRGRRFLLRGDNLGSLDAGAPLFLRRFQVGEVTRVALAPRGAGVVLEVFVDAPYHQHVTTNTRFWNASGLDVTLDARGIKLDTQSVASVLTGGIALEAPAGFPEGAPAEEGAGFLLFPGREAALRNPGSSTDHYRLVFSRSVRGLAVGAPVELFGFDVGEVSAISLDFDHETSTFRTVVEVGVQPARLPGGESRKLLRRLAQRGLRAQLRSVNLLTGQRYVAFDDVPGAGRVRLAPGQLPTFEGGADDLPTALTRLATKLEKVPVAELAGELRQTLAGAARLFPRAEAVMGQAGKTLASVDQTMSPDAPVQRDLRTSLRDLGSAGTAVRSLAEYLERHPESLIRGKKEDRR
jgi:paraquat-inducible protein B